MGFIKRDFKRSFKFVGIDPDANKKAANLQAQATKEASDRVSADALASARAAQQQIESTAAQNAARSAANDLLNRPIETANVDLSAGASDTEDDLLGRRRGGVRANYRSGNAQAGLVVN